MRFLLILLLLTNLVLFLYARREDVPQPPPPPVAVDKIVLVKSLAENEPIPPIAGRSADASNEAAPSATACLQWGPLTETQIDNARAALNRLPNINAYHEVRRPGPPRSWLVSLENFTTHNAANTRAAELRRQNINDISIIESGQGFMLSLGVFSAEQGAQSRAAMLAERKVSGVKITPRTTMAIFFVVPNPDPSLAQSLRELLARFADAHVQPCGPVSTP